VISSGLVVNVGAEGRASATGVADLEPPVVFAEPRFLVALMGERSLAGVDDPATLSGRAMVDECGVQSLANPTWRHAHVITSGNAKNLKGREPRQLRVGKSYEGGVEDI
jgi:hypothetical protein